MKKLLGLLLLLAAIALMGVLLLSLLAPFVAEEVLYGGRFLGWGLVLVVGGPLALAIGRAGFGFMRGAGGRRSEPDETAWYALGALYASTAGFALFAVAGGEMGLAPFMVLSFAAALQFASGALKSRLRRRHG